MSPFDDIETAPRTEIESLQNDRLTTTLERAYEDLPYVRTKFDSTGVDPERISGTDDLSKLPFTTKADFREQYPFGTFACPREDVARVHASSGTTGKMKIVGYTGEDLQNWAHLGARTLVAAGVTPSDVVQNATGYGLFTGGLGWHDAAEHLGATVVPTGGGNTARQVQLMNDLGTTTLVSTPSYALYVAETAAERDLDPQDLPVEQVLVGAESSTAEMRAEIADRFDALVTDNYGLSELQGPGMATECAEAREDMHLWEDFFYPEVIDPETGERLEAGEHGELVLTSLHREAMPVVRYRTGDVTSIHYEGCDCGRTHARIENIVGRSDDLLVVRGVNVYPSEIESVLLRFEECAPHYRIDLYRENHLDRIELTVERVEGFDGDASALRERLSRQVESVVSLSPDELDVLPYGTIDRTETGKTKRVYDHR